MCVHVHVCIPHFFIHLVIDGHLVVSMVWVVDIMLLQMWGCIYIGGLVSLLLSDIYPEVELLNHMLVLFLIF